MAPGQARRRVGAAVFVLVCAPCFVGFLVFVAPALAVAVVGSLVLQSVVAGALGGVALLAYRLWSRRRFRRLAAETAPQAANLNASQR